MSTFEIDLDLLKPVSAHCTVAAERGFIDDVNIPQETRRRVARSFEMLKGKKQVVPLKKHGNILL